MDLIGTKSEFFNCIFSPKLRKRDLKVAFAVFDRYFLLNLIFLII